MTWEKQKNENSSSKPGSFISFHVPAEGSRQRCRQRTLPGWVLPLAWPEGSSRSADLLRPCHKRPVPTPGRALLHPAAVARGAGAARPWGNHRYLHGDFGAPALQTGRASPGDRAKPFLLHTGPCFKSDKNQAPPRQYTPQVPSTSRTSTAASQRRRCVAVSPVLPCSGRGARLPKGSRACKCYTLSCFRAM